MYFWANRWSAVFNLHLDDETKKSLIYGKIEAFLSRQWLIDKHSGSSDVFWEFLKFIEEKYWLNKEQLDSISYTLRKWSYLSMLNIYTAFCEWAWYAEAISSHTVQSAREVLPSI